MNLCLSKVTIHSLSHNCPIETRLERRLGKIYPCPASLDNVLVGSGIGVWMPLCMSCGVSYLLGFLMAPLCGLLFSGRLGSFLCILSRLLGRLYGVVVGIEYY